MRRTGTVLVYVAGVFLVGALVAPIVFWSVQAIVSWLPNLRSLAENPFSRFVSRTLMIVALAALWPLYHALGKPSADEMGLRFVGNCRAALSSGFGLGFISIGLFVLAGMTLDIRVLRGSSIGAHVGNSILLSLLGAALAAPLEEFLFRGVLFGCSRSRGRWVAPLMISSVVFATVHFLQTPKYLGGVRWSSGFGVLAAMFTGSGAENRWPQFINLTLCGVLLAWAYQRTGSLAFSIGLHGGWIFWLKLANTITTMTASSALWGTRKVIDGWVATFILLGVAAVLPILTRNSKPSNSLCLEHWRRNFSRGLTPR